ncbi:MAG: ATP-binding cassette domain-containing protein [Candidatus Marinimicrobia bacterium]|nr:ATP-binding cassette domain-containing protein [Candidatus Neomarinimicrobiota bacterium]
MLKIKNINKSYSGLKVVDNISFNIERGKITGLLGPNGAGKTTSIRMIMDIIKADEGEILLDGQAVDIRNMPGYLPEDRGLYQKTGIAETLKYFAALRSINSKESDEKIGYWLDRFSLSGQEKDKIATLSKGNQQKIQLIIALFSDPDFLILDEPFTGLDPANQQLVREIMQEYIEQDKAILLSTHQMEIAEKLCDQIVLIHKGQIILNDEIGNIKKQFKSDDLLFDIIFSNTVAPIPSLLEDQTYGKDVLKGKIPQGKNIQEIIDSLNKIGQINSFYNHTPSLEEIFLQLTRANNE